MKIKQSILVLSTLMLSLTFFTQAQKKVAVVSFYMNKKVQPGDLGLGGEALKKAADLADNPAFKLDPMLERLHETFFNDLSKEFSFELLDESSVTENPAYKNYKLGFDTTKAINKAVMSYLLHYDGYKYLREGGKLDAKETRDEYRLMKIFSDQADGIVFVNFWFAFSKKLAVGGTGSADMRAFFQMLLFNKERKKVFRYQESASSKKSIGIVAGVPVMNIEKIKPLCEDAFGRMLVKIKKDIPKLTKKVDKKL